MTAEEIREIPTLEVLFLFLPLSSGTTSKGQLSDGRKATQWKTNYHTARAMMSVAAMRHDMQAAPAREPR